MNQTQETELQKPSFSISARPDGTLQVISPNGVKINDILPPYINIVYSDSFYSVNGDQNEPGRIEIPKDINNQGAFASIAIAHELGHLLNPDNDEIAAATVPFLFASETLDNSVDSIKIGINYYNNILRQETEAWNYGKEGADKLGANELDYESSMNSCIETYRYPILAWLADKASKLPPDQLPTPDEQISIYQTDQQDNVPTNLRQFIAMLQERKTTIDKNVTLSQEKHQENIERLKKS